MADSPLIALVKLTPKEAVAYLKQRDQLTKSFNWQDVWQEEHAHQFTVSRLANLDILEAMRDGILSSVKGDSSRQYWTKNAKELLIQAGWWGKKSLSDPTTGEIVTTTFDPARLKLIFDTNTRMAYSAGLWQRIERNKQTHPYIRYITRRDERVREQHRSWDNLTLPIDHSFWKTHFPPNGWRCRCRAMSISQDSYDAGMSPNGERLNKAAPDVQYKDWTNKRTGVIERVPVGIDPGFGYNPGMARSDSLSRVAVDKLDAVPAVMRRAALEPQVVGEIGVDFKQSVNDALNALPERFRTEVFGRGYQVVLGKSVVEIEPSLAGKNPRGYKDATWENADGAHLSGKRIAIGETSIDPFTSELVFTSPKRAAALLRHEVGHALDVSLRLSIDKKFVDSWNKEASPIYLLLDKLDGAIYDDLDYLLQDLTVAGHQETFAELFADFYGGGSAEVVSASKVFPETYSIVQAVILGILKDK